MITKYLYILNQFIALTLIDFVTERFESHTFRAWDETKKQTNSVTDQRPELYSPIFQYMCGNCYFNSKLSHGLSLSENDKKFSDGIDEAVSLTAGVDGPLYLFHGFEPGLNYGEDSWLVGSKIQLGFHLSKTAAFWVAERFSSHWNWYFEKLAPNPITGKPDMDTMPHTYNIGYWKAFKSIFVQKYLFCVYPEGKKSHHLSLDTRVPDFILDIKPEMIVKEEFEFLGSKNEQFKLVGIKNKYSLTTPFIKRFYVLEATG
jgi:hypothetical protein